MPNPNRVGQTLGRYRLLELLGKGGFAEVYLGEQMYLGTKHAIKVLYSKMLDKENIQKFQDEARRIAHLRHPYIVQVTYFDIEDDTPFLVMDYVPHGSLRERYPKGTRIPLLTAISYVKQLAHNMQPPIVHRDVKPENILLGQNNEVLLSDFGIATIAATYLQ